MELRLVVVEKNGIKYFQYDWLHFTIFYPFEQFDFLLKKIDGRVRRRHNRSIFKAIRNGKEFMKGKIFKFGETISSMVFHNELNRVALKRRLQVVHARDLEVGDEVFVVSRVEFDFVHCVVKSCFLTKPEIIQLFIDRFEKTHPLSDDMVDFAVAHLRKNPELCF